MQISIKRPCYLIDIAVPEKMLTPTPISTENVLLVYALITYYHHQCETSTNFSFSVEPKEILKMLLKLNSLHTDQ